MLLALLTLLYTPLVSVLQILLHVDPLGIARNERKLSTREIKVPKIPSPGEPNEEWSVYSFQLAKFLSQLIASRRRKTPMHSDGEERKKRRLKVEGAGREFIPSRWAVKSVA